jgi:hypothetical protein
MFKFPLFCAILLVHTVSIAQPKLYFGADVAYAADHYKIEDPAGYINKIPLDGVFYGVNLRLMVDNYSYLETGIYARSHREGIGFRNDIYTTGTGPQSILLPLRFGLSIPLFHEKIRINPVAGYTLGIRNDHETIGIDGEFNQPDNISYNIIHDYPTRIYSLIQTGLNIDFRIFHKSFIHLSGNHYAGLQDILVQDISYTVNNGPQNKAKQTYKGSFLSIGIGVSIPLGDAAINKK